MEHCKEHIKLLLDISCVFYFKLFKIMFRSSDCMVLCMSVIVDRLWFGKFVKEKGCDVV